MSRILLLAALTAGSLVGSGSAAFAQYRADPQQSLTGSCENIQNLPSGYVTAECRTRDGQYRWSSIYYPNCRSALTNQDGVMACTGASATGGSYVQRNTAPASGFESVLGALAGALFGTTGQSTTAYTPGASYPVWGESGYGDPRYDPRFGEQGWGYGSQGEWVAIARRQNWLEQRIATGERNGSLTRTEAANLRRELTALQRTEQGYTQGGLSNAERATLDRQFEALSARVRLETRDNDNQWANINQRQADLDARIDAGVRDGSLSRQEAVRLRTEFQDLARLETQYRQSGLTYEERADLDRRFDVLSNRLVSERTDNQWANINQRQADLDARIDAGLRDRSISRQEAVTLRSDYQDLARLETQYRQSGLTNQERADLDRRFDLLSNRLPGQQTAWANINQRQANLDRRIDAGLRNRSLTTREAQALRTEYQSLLRLETDYSRNGLTTTEQADLDRRFDALSARIRDERRDNETAASNVNDRQVRLEARIEAGVQSGALTRRQATDLRAQFGDLARLEAQYRSDGLNAAERDYIDRRYDELSLRIGDERAAR